MRPFAFSGLRAELLGVDTIRQEHQLEVPIVYHHSRR